MRASSKATSPKRHIPAHAAVTGNEVWYRDGPPSLGASFTAAHTAKRRDELLDLIARAYQQAKASGDEQLAEQLGPLWDKLHDCYPGARCGSLACVACARAFQRTKVAAQESFLNGLPQSGGKKLVFVSLIPKGMIFPPGQFANIDIPKANRWLKDALKKLGLNRMTVGSVDLGWENRRGGNYIQLHWHLAMRTTNPKKLKAKLQKAFPRFKKYERPVDVAEANDTGFLPYTNKMIKLPDLLRRNRTHLPELLLALDRTEPMDLSVLSKLRLSAQAGALTFTRNPQTKSKSKQSKR